MKTRLLLALVGLGLVLALVPRAPRAVPFERAHFAMGTIVILKLYADGDEVDRLSALAFAEIDRIDTVMSHYIETSELSRLNRHAPEEAVAVSPQLLQLLPAAQRYAGATLGAFDVTVGALARLWGFPDARQPPDAAAIELAGAATGYRLLQIRADSVRFLHPEMRIDLGAIAKGYAVDRAAEVLVQAGSNSGIIIAGGDILYWGQKPDGHPWRLGVQHPREPARIVEAEEIGLNALATSGDYEQVFEHGGVRYHHLLDPRSGSPARKCVSATAWAPTAMEADAIATALFVLGPRRGLDWIETMPHAEALIFFEERGQLRHRSSSGVTGKLHFAEKANAE